jgi:hypothetical protein
MTHVAIFPGFLLLLLLTIAVVVVIVRLCSKRGSLAAVIVLAVLALLGAAYLVLGVSYQRAVPATATVYRHEQPRSPAPDPAAIWQPGIEDQFEANLYPSKRLAVRSLGLGIDTPIRQLLGDQTWPTRGILFEGGHDRELLDEFIKSAARSVPQSQWTVAPETVAVEPGEVGIRLDLSVFQAGPAPWASSDSASEMTRGTLRATVLAGNNQISINAKFDEKPWIEDFYGLWNGRPNRHLIIAKSAESCVTRAEAERQAIDSACSQLTTLLRQTPRAKATPSLPRKVTPNDVLERDFIVDRFSQKFDGMAGEIWRHALLIDASVDKMEELAAHKAVLARTHRLNWARMIGSVAGLLALITVAYIFLNAATKGYYTWSLRIAGIVLAAAVIILFVA